MILNTVGIFQVSHGVSIVDRHFEVVVDTLSAE